MSNSSFDFASIANVKFIEEQYESFKKNPDSVDPLWKSFFSGIDFATTNFSNKTSPKVGSETGHIDAKVEAFIHVYRRLGHLSAHLSPLDELVEGHEDLSPKTHGLEKVTKDRKFFPVNLPLKEGMSFEYIHQLLLDTYCRSIGADFRELNDIKQVVWLQEKMESCRNKPAFSNKEKKLILEHLTQAEGFERFLQDRYLGQKRFSLEGTDSLIALMKAMLDQCSLEGAEEVNIGMAHRGRLNVLANIMGKSAELIFKDFEGKDFNPFDIDGDVKYHKGFANEVDTAHGNKVRLYLLPNPSHLEAVNPVVEGFARARQDLLKDAQRKKVVPLLIHGDAAFIAQGSVAETLNLAELDAYKTGGTIHIIINNQIGFTANPSEGRSCRYASEIAKVIRAPVFHVNADDPEACVWVAKLAASYRQLYGKDVVIDLIGYRKHGHNETDEPSFTQPVMYKKIKSHPSVLSLYEKQLISEGVIQKEDSATMLKNYRDRLQKAMEFVKNGGEVQDAVVPNAFKNISHYEKVDQDAFNKAVKTGIKSKELKKLTEAICTSPASFTINPKIAKLIESRKSMLDGDGNIDWGLAEKLCYASLAQESHPVRLSGQDCRRGTFSHRQAVWFDFENGSTYEPLNNLGINQARVDIINSPLSELAVMGFDFGYAVADPNALVMWEAQFGDFANGAQIIIDQFLVASEAKWKQTSGLCLLLPHGYEGQGPEHSSARIERFLQLCGNLNIQVAVPTKPAQLFHLLRRQLKRSFRKPLIIMTPKSLLRHPKVISNIKEFEDGFFQEVLTDESIVKPKIAEQIIFCSGKIYYELTETREKDENLKSNTPIIRIEQLYPFPMQAIRNVLNQYSNAKRIVWAQEEPENMGAWTFVRPQLENLLSTQAELIYCGRKSSGSTAEGSLKSHVQEQQRIINTALGLQSKLSLISEGKQKSK